MFDAQQQKKRSGRALLALSLVGTTVLAGCGGSAAATDRPGVADVVAEDRVGERLVDLTVESPALGTAAEVRLLTPEGWDDREPGDAWPVLYLLDGGAGEHDAWTNDTDVKELPELRDVLVVMPDMPLFGFYSDWWNGGAGGPPEVETFHLDELLGILERDYGAGDRRAIAGVSQGGYGAVAYAARRPGVFRAAASYSGWLHPLEHPEVVLAAAEFADDLLGDGSLDPEALWGDPVGQRDNWERNDPYYMADRLRNTPVYVASGDGTLGELDPPDYPDDELFPEIEALADEFPADVVDLTEALMNSSSQPVAHRYERAGVPVTEHFYAGTHSWPYWERELHRSLPLLLDTLDAGRTSRSSCLGPRPCTRGE